METETKKLTTIEESLYSKHLQGWAATLSRLVGQISKASRERQWGDEEKKAFAERMGNAIRIALYGSYDDDLEIISATYLKNAVGPEMKARIIAGHVTEFLAKVEEIDGIAQEALSRAINN